MIPFTLQKWAKWVCAVKSGLVTLGQVRNLKGAHREGLLGCCPVVS